MGTTTKMAIPYPEATGLVKDGWEDMKDIATQVDAKSGLVLISTTTIGSAVSSVTIPNVFSSNFDNYRVIFNFANATNTVTTQTRFQMAASSTPNTSANYYRRSVQSNDAALALSNESGTTSVYLGSLTTGSTMWSGFTIDFIAPFLAKNTVYVMNTIGLEGSLLSHVGGGLHNVSTSYDGFTWFLSSGTITGGTISVYAYNK